MYFPSPFVFFCPKIVYTFLYSLLLLVSNCNHFCWNAFYLFHSGSAYTFGVCLCTYFWAILLLIPQVQFVTLLLLSTLTSFGLPTDSASARYKADQMAKTVQARISANRTSQSIDTGAGFSIYSREPNRKCSVFIGNLTWVSNSFGWEPVQVAPLDSLCVCVCVRAHTCRTWVENDSHMLNVIASHGSGNHLILFFLWEWLYLKVINLFSNWWVFCNSFILYAESLCKGTPNYADILLLISYKIGN